MPVSYTHLDVYKRQDLLRNIAGIKLLSQQFGVMEEEFYEPVIGF